MGIIVLDIAVLSMKFFVHELGILLEFVKLVLYFMPELKSTF